MHVGLGEVICIVDEEWPVVDEDGLADAKVGRVVPVLDLVVGQLHDDGTEGGCEEKTENGK